MSNPPVYLIISAITSKKAKCMKFELGGGLRELVKQTLLNKMGSEQQNQGNERKKNEMHV